LSPSRKDESDAEVTVSEEHIAYALRQVEQGTPVAELCRKLGISEQTFYTRAGGWKGSSMAWPSCAALDRDCAIEPAGFCVTAGTCCCSTPNTNLVSSTYLRRSAALLIHAMTAARKAAWSGMPSALARFSRCLQTLAGKRTERRTVGPVSVPFLGLPRPTWMEIPSAAIRRAYGLRRTLAWSKFTSGISRNDARDGHRSQSLRPTNPSQSLQGGQQDLADSLQALPTHPLPRECANDVRHLRGTSAKEDLRAPFDLTAHPSQLHMTIRSCLPVHTRAHRRLISTSPPIWQ